jgi:hypothetical protein
VRDGPAGDQRDQTTLVLCTDILVVWNSWASQKHTRALCQKYSYGSALRVKGRITSSSTKPADLFVSSDCRGSFSCL